MSVLEIIDKAEKHFGYKMHKSRTKTACMVRHAVWWYLRETTPMTHKEIGWATGGYDHSSVVHGICAAKRYIAGGNALWAAWRDMAAVGSFHKATPEATEPKAPDWVEPRAFTYLDTKRGEIVKVIVERQPAPPMADVGSVYKFEEHLAPCILRLTKRETCQS